MLLDQIKFGTTALLLCTACGRATPPAAADVSEPMPANDRAESAAMAARPDNSMQQPNAMPPSTPRASASVPPAAAPLASAGAAGTKINMPATQGGVSGGGAGMLAASTAGIPAAGAAGSQSGACEKGSIKAAEVVFIGESFIAQTGAIPRLVIEHARKASTVAASENYRSFAVSGTQLTTGEIPMQYARAKADGPVKVVLMDGGGNDLLFGGFCKDGAASCQEVVSVEEKLFQQMGSDGVKDVLYFFYPDPMGIGADIKDAMDVLRPEMQKLCAATTDVRCVWVDQRESWDGHYAEFTSDGIHPTEAGAAASAEQIWKSMQDNCIAQ